LLLANGELRSDFDACIKEGSIDIRILSSRNLVEFEQRYTIPWGLSAAEYCRFELSWLGSPVVDAVFAAPITHFRMKSCSMWSSDFTEAFQALADTLRVVELVNVAIWGDQNFPRTLFPVLHCLRDDLRLERLVMDDLRAMNKDYEGDDDGKGPGILVVTGRYWDGQQRIREGINILTGFDDHGLDGSNLDDWFERGIRSYERQLQDMSRSATEHLVDDTDYPGDRAQLEQCLEEGKRRYAEYKVTRARVKEAMARVEAGDFST
jgi:hypothetical protein